MKNTILTFCLFFSISSFAQYSVKGKIVDADTKEPLSFGSVLLYKEGKNIESKLPDASGAFIFETIPTGEYTIELKAVGYVAHKTSPFVINAQNIDLGLILLSVDNIELEGVEIVREKRNVIYKLDKRIISAANDVVAGSGTASDILSRVPSVRVDAEGNVTFRGSSGFLIHVNGKPSMFNAAQALQQIPSSQIDNIEIITTPSARSQTDGEAGIINIITKQQYGEGFSGAVNTFGSTYGSRGVDFTLNKQSGEHRFKIGGIYGQRLRKSDFEQEKTTIVNNTSITSHSKGPREGEVYSYLLQAGWQLSKKKTNYYVDLTGGYEGRANDGDLDYSEEQRKVGLPTVFNKYNNKDEYDLHETLFGGTVGFNHKFDKEGQTLKGSFYLKYGGDALEYFKSDLLDDAGKRIHGHQAWEAEHRWNVDGQIDYVHPYSKTGHFETGYLYTSYLEDGDYKMEYWNPSTQQFDFRNDIYNTFYFQRGVNTVYLLGNQRVDKFEFQAGVRGEHTHQVLRSSKTWANRTQNRFELFPSAHVGYSLSDNASFTAAYSRRTNRPQLFFMEPYITFRDYYTAQIGNPDIRPEYVNSYELTFKKSFDENMLQIALFHRSRTDKIERLRVPYEAGITLDSMANVGNDYSTGIEFGFNFKPMKAWSLVFNGNTYHYNVKNKLDLAGRNESSINYGFALNNNIQIAKYTMLQFDGTFVGPTVRTQGMEEGFFYTDFGVRQQFLKGRLTAGLSFRNFINSAKYRSNIDTDRLVSHTKINPKFPLLTLNVGYTFNNFKQKSKGREGHDFFEGTNY